MKVFIFVFALIGYVNCPAQQCHTGCLNPAPPATGCTPQTCTSPNDNCKTIVTFANMVAASATRACIYPSDCVEATTPTSSPFTDCTHEPNAAPDITGKTILECYTCSGIKTSACASAQTPSSPKTGGWTVAASAACIACWTKVTWSSYDVATTGNVVARGCISTATPAPPDSYSVGSGDKLAVCTAGDGNLCNSAAADVTSMTTTTTTAAAPTAAATPPAAATTTSTAATTTAASTITPFAIYTLPAGASTFSPATFAVFLISAILMKIFS